MKTHLAALAGLLIGAGLSWLYCSSAAEIAARRVAEGHATECREPRWFRRALEAALCGAIGPALAALCGAIGAFLGPFVVLFGTLRAFSR